MLGSTEVDSRVHVYTCTSMTARARVYVHEHDRACTCIRARACIMARPQRGRVLETSSPGLEGTLNVPSRPGEDVFPLARSDLK